MTMIFFSFSKGKDKLAREFVWIGTAISPSLLHAGLLEGALGVVKIQPYNLDDGLVENFTLWLNTLKADDLPVHKWTTE